MGSYLNLSHRPVGRYKRIATLCLLISLSILTPSHAQERSFDLKSCIHYTLENHTDLINVQLKKTADQEKIKEVKSFILPQITGSLSYQYNLQIPTVFFNGQVVRMSSQYELRPGINATQILYDPKYHGDILVAQLQAELSQYNVKRSKIEIVTAVMKAYYNVLISQKRLELVNNNISRLKKSLMDSQLRYENGLAQKVDVNRIQVLYNNALAENKNTLRLIETQEKLLKFQMGMDIDSLLKINGNINEEIFDDTVFQPTDSTFYKNRVEYAIANKQWELTRLYSGNIKKIDLPSLSLFGNYQVPLMGEDFGKIFSMSYHPAFSIGFKLQVPIFSGFKKKHQLNQSKLREEIALNQLNYLKNNIRYESAQMRQQFGNALNNLQTQKENMKLAQLNYNNLKYQYENGIRPSIEMLESQNALKEAENHYISALYEVLINKINLDKAQGKINY